MKKRILWLVLSCLMILALVLVSCSTTTPATTATQSQTTAATSGKTTATVATTTATATVKTTTTPATTSASATSAGTPQYGGILRIGDYRSSTFIGNPAKLAETYALRQAAPAMESLMRVDATGALVPWLAKSWSADPVAKTVTLVLNTGIMFSDGTPFNAAAVKWNLDNDISSKQSGTSSIKSVDVVNDNTVRINMTAWDNTLEPMLGYSYIGSIISPTAAQKNGLDWANSHPVGTGPFIFETWIPQVSISFSRNSNYWQQGKPYLDRIENVTIADTTVGFLNFKAARTDIFVDPPSIDLPNTLKTYPNSTIASSTGWATVRDGAIFDSANPKSPFYDVRVRQAVQYAVNVDEMNQAITGGIGDTTNQFVVKSSWGYNPSVVGYPYNPAKAKQLLSDAGYTPGQIKTTFNYQIGYPQDDQAAALKGYLAAVGINLTLNAVSLANLQNLQATGWDGLVGLITIASPDPVQAFRDRYIGLDARYFANMLVPPDFKQAVLSAVSAPDFATEQKFAQQASKLWTDQYCLDVHFYLRVSACAKQSYVHNDGMYSPAAFATSTIWSPEIAWKDPGH